MNIFAESANDFIREISRQKDAIILQQLGDLIKSGLLVIEEEQPILTKDELTGNFKYSSAIRLVLRDKEIFEQLKKERDEALDKLVAIRDILNPKEEVCE